MADPVARIRALETELDETYRSITELTNELVDTKEQLEQLSLYDELTGLPNRTLYRDRFEVFRETANRENKPFAVFLMDLNRFKSVNDTFGHDAGDHVLQIISERLKQRLRGTDTVARMGGDEFAFLLQLQNGLQDSEEVAREIVNIVQQPIEVRDTLVDVGSSIGIAFYPSSHDDLSELLRYADKAMYEAKKRGGGFFVHTDRHDDKTAKSPSIFLGELQSAIENNQLEFYFQPKVDMQTMEWSGSEALMRWHHPQRGMIMPDEFILMAERSTLIVPFTIASLSMAIERLASSPDAKDSRSIAVNLSPRSLHDADLAGEVVAQVRNWKKLADLLIFEITESALMIDPDRAIRTLTQFASLGIRISIDDFGTGYSSLSYLSQLPVQEVKIDRSFVRKMHMHREDLAIIQSLVSLANNLEISVVAEGVETRDDWDTLANIGCHLAQGYYISRPVPTQELDTWSKRWQPRNPTGTNFEPRSSNA